MYLQLLILSQLAVSNRTVISIQIVQWSNKLGTVAALQYASSCFKCWCTVYRLHLHFLIKTPSKLSNGFYTIYHAKKKKKVSPKMRKEICYGKLRKWRILIFSVVSLHYIPYSKENLYFPSGKQQRREICNKSGRGHNWKHVAWPMPCTSVSQATTTLISIPFSKMSLQNVLMLLRIILISGYL